MEAARTMAAIPQVSLPMNGERSTPRRIPTSDIHSGSPTTINTQPKCFPGNVNERTTNHTNRLAKYPVYAFYVERDDRKATPYDLQNLGDTKPPQVHAV